jgi:hypothetical protein
LKDTCYQCGSNAEGAIQYIPNHSKAPVPLHWKYQY